MRSRIIGVRFRLFELRLGGVGRDWYLDFLLGLRVEAGVCARRRSNFLCDRKSPKNASPSALKNSQPIDLIIYFPAFASSNLQTHPL